jgi:hypothetical protein
LRQNGTQNFSGGQASGRLQQTGNLVSHGLGLGLRQVGADGDRQLLFRVPCDGAGAAAAIEDCCDSVGQRPYLPDLGRCRFSGLFEFVVCLESHPELLGGSEGARLNADPNYPNGVVADDSRAAPAAD